MTVEIFLSDFQNIVNGVFRIFIFKRLISSVLRNYFSVARLSTVCIYIFLFAVRLWEWYGNLNNAMGIPWEWE